MEAGSILKTDFNSSCNKKLKECQYIRTNSYQSTLIEPNLSRENNFHSVPRFEIFCADHGPAQTTDKRIIPYEAIITELRLQESPSSV